MEHLLAAKLEMNTDLKERIEKEIRQKETNPAVAMFMGTMVIVNDEIPPNEVHFKDRQGKLLKLIKIPPEKI